MHIKSLMLGWYATHVAGSLTGTNLTTQSQGNVSGIAAGQTFNALAVSYLQHLQQGAPYPNHTFKSIDLEPWANQNLSVIDSNGASWVNGTFHGATTNVNLTHSGVIIEDPHGNKMPLRCRGDTAEQMQEDCTEKAAKYICNGDDKLRVRDDDNEHCKNKTGIIVGGVVGGVGGASLIGGGAFWGWKVHASGQVLTGAIGSDTASEVSIVTLVSDMLTKLTTSTSASTSSSVIDVVTQSDLILTNLADQGVTSIGPELIQPGLELAQSTLQNVDISCQAGLPIEQATTRAVQQTISEVAPQVLQNVEGGSVIAQTLAEDEAVFTQQLKGTMEEYFEEQSRLGKYKGTRPTAPETTKPDTPDPNPKEGKPESEPPKGPEQGPGNGDGTPHTDPKDPNPVSPPKHPKEGKPENNAGKGPEQEPGNGNGTPPTDPKGPVPDSPPKDPKNGGSGDNGSKEPPKAPENGNGTPLTGTTTIEPEPAPISQPMADLMRNTPPKVRNWDTRWNSKLPKVYTDQMNLFPEDFDWEAAIRYWRNMGDLYRKERDTTKYGPSAHACAKRVIRLGEWRNLWQTWKAAQQHPVNPPNHPYTIHRPSTPSAPPSPPVPTVVAPPPSGISPASVSGFAHSVPTWLYTYTLPAPPRPTTLQTSRRPAQTITKIVSTYTTLPQSVVLKTISTTVLAPAPPTSVPVPEPPVHQWPSIPCDPDYGPRLPHGFECAVYEGRDYFEVMWDPKVIYEGKPCEMKDNDHLPKSWICVGVNPKAPPTLERGLWTPLNCKTHRHAYPQECKYVPHMYEPMDENGFLWDMRPRPQ